MRLGEAVIGISQYLVPGLLALGYGEVKRDGEPIRLLALLWEWGQRRTLRRSSSLPKGMLDSLDPLSTRSPLLDASPELGDKKETSGASWVPLSSLNLPSEPGYPSMEPHAPRPRTA
jgi:hypothetical protein